MRTLVLTLAAAFALGGAAAAQTAAPSPAASAAPSAGASAVPSVVPSPAAVVHVKDFAYLPATVTVSAGQTVQFVQDDQTPHTVSAADKSFDSGNLDLHQTWSHTFAKPGTYAYSCSYHPAMKGAVVVK
jgi:plastocyanin